MGYTTDFTGSFKFNKPLDKDTLIFLQKFNETRRMARKLPKEFGIEGEFYVDAPGYAGQDREDNIVDYNRPPKTQPGLWCQWRPTDDGTKLEWDGGEKFYNYVEWLEYLIKNVLSPRGYKLTGEIEWAGEDQGDIGKIIVKNNKISLKHGAIVYR